MANTNRNKQIAREIAEHPWMSREQAARVVRDHNRAKDSKIKPSTFRKFQSKLRKAFGLKPKKVRRK